MPDFNPAIAAGVNSGPIDISKTLGTIANVDLANAHAGLYNLQAQQQARQYNALQAAAEAYRSNKDPVDSYLSAGGDPAGANTLQSMFANQRAMSQTPGGVMPQQYEQLRGAEEKVAETRKLGADTDRSVAETTKIGAETDKTRAGLASQIAGGIFADPGNDNTWRTAVNAHYNTFGGPELERQQLLAIKDPNQRLQIAKAYSAQGVSPDEMNKPTQVTPGNQVTTPARLMTPAIPGESGQPANAPAIPGLTPGERETQTSRAKATTDYLQGEGYKQYSGATTLLGRMKTVDMNIDKLGPQWMGTGADTKASAAKAWNSMLDTFGVKDTFHIDPNKVATWEEFNKEQIRAGMELINSNFGGSREAASIIQMGRTAVAGVQNSYLGAKYVSSTIKAAAQRQIDLYEYQQQHDNMLPSKAAVQFNKDHPPEQYAMKGIADVIPQGAKQYLAQHPETAAKFNKNFGDGTAQYILGTAQ